MNLLNRNGAGECLIGQPAVESAIDEKKIFEVDLLEQRPLAIRKGIVATRRDC